MNTQVLESNPYPYSLLIELTNGEVVVMTKLDGSHLVADEANKELLIDMGAKLLDEKLIKGYQLVKAVGPAIRAI